MRLLHLGSSETRLPYVFVDVWVLSSNFGAFYRITVAVPVVCIVLTRQTVCFLRRLLAVALSTDASHLL